MSPSELRRLAADYVPGEGALDIEALGVGLASRTFEIRRGGARYVLKLKDAGRGDRAARQFEIEVLKSAGRAGLAPELAAADAERGVLLLKWLDGAPLDEAAAREPGSLCGLLRAVHALPVPSDGRWMPVRGWIEHYQGALRECGRAVRAPERFLADGMLEALEAEPRTALAVCHSDLHRLNVLVRSAPDAGALALLDWEYAHLAEQLWDLAGWSANNDFTPLGQAQLLEAYYGSSPSGALKVRLARLVWLYDYLCLLWIRLYVSRRGEKAAFLARAQLLERRLQSPVYGTIPVPTNF